MDKRIYRHLGNSNRFAIERGHYIPLSATHYIK